MQSQLSQDVGGLAVGASTWSLLLQPNGRVDALLRAPRTGDEEVLIDVDDGWGETVLAACSAIRVARSWTGSTSRCSPCGARGCGRSGAVPAWWGVECGYDEVRPVGLGSAGRRRSGRPRCLGDQPRRAGWPAMGAEITEQTIPAELGPLLDVAVSFTRGATPARSSSSACTPMARRRPGWSDGSRRQAAAAGRRAGDR